MDRGAWQATVHEVARIQHDLMTNPPPSICGGVGAVGKRKHMKTLYTFCIIFLPGGGCLSPGEHSRTAGLGSQGLPVSFLHPGCLPCALLGLHFCLCRVAPQVNTGNRWEAASLAWILKSQRSWREGSGQPLLSAQAPLASAGNRA